MSRGWTKDTQLATGKITIQVIAGGDQITVAVTGRVTVDSSPDLRAVVLEVLHRCAAPLIVIDLSGVPYLDMSGLATLLESLKAARDCSVKLRVIGMSGEARNLAEIAQLDMIFRAWGSEVVFS
jgi:anti-sigma B factor antagonist